MCRGETVGYSPIGLAAAAATGLATLGASRLLLQQPIPAKEQT